MIKNKFVRFNLRSQALMLGAVLLLVGGSAQAQTNITKTKYGLLIPYGSAQVELAVASSDALRLSLAYDHQSQPSASTFLADTNAGDAVKWHQIKKNDVVGIATDAGKLLLNLKSGEWTLQNSQGETLIPWHQLGGLNSQGSNSHQSVSIMLGGNQQAPFEVYGCGNGVKNLTQTEAKAGVFNGQAVLPYYWSKAGYAALAVTTDDNHPARWRAAANGDYVTWNFPGSRADLYLMPAASLKAAAGAYARLTGAAPVPPRWTFGYLQSRWGWENRAYIEDTLKHFHDLNLPVDAFIYDFEWYTTKPDYEVPDEGKAGFKDFGWNTNLFSDPSEQIKSYEAQGVHSVGIRKPRLGNDDLLKMVRAKGWDLQSHSTGKVAARDLDFANPDVREWYINQSAGLFKSGIDGWWNDEGEASYTTYFYWNQSEWDAIKRFRPNERLWTLNRSFSPGTQRFGAVAWTGDIVSSWDVLAATPTSLLNWGLSGMPYGACDIGGFFGNPAPELICRWMEAGVFFPVFRTHSEVHYQPHFPWLYGTNALAVLRQTIDLRYRLIPYYYSLAHETFDTGVPLMRPLVMEFPDDAHVANLSDEWLMGHSLLAAPILQPGGKRSVYLPAGNWYAFGTNQTLTGGSRISVTAALAEIPIYVCAGTILPLGPVVEHTSELPGGPLDLQIYPGKDATFTLVEDDGSTTAYLKGQVRQTTFKWNDKKRSLSWKREGNYSGKDVFQKMHVTVFDPKGVVETDCDLNSSGHIKP
ncbi:MAG TPA: TIM-barrel domain-containing protein [Verrucomicrobiae bacterium]|jgi:alpha-glucosidase